MKNKLSVTLMILSLLMLGSCSQHSEKQKCYVAIDGTSFDDIGICESYNEQLRSLLNTQLTLAETVGDYTEYKKKVRETSIEFEFKRYEIYQKIAIEANLDTIPYQFRDNKTIIEVLKYKPKNIPQSKRESIVNH